MSKVYFKMRGTNSVFRSQRSENSFNRMQIKTLETRLLSILMRTNKEVSIVIQEVEDYVPYPLSKFVGVVYLRSSS